METLMLNSVQWGWLALLSLHLKSKTSSNLLNCSLVFPKVSQIIYPHTVPCMNSWLICGHLLVWLFRCLISVWHPITLSMLLSFSALHHAALTGTTELLSLLLEAQATVDIKDINGKMTAQIKQFQQTTHFWYLLLNIEDNIEYYLSHNCRSWKLKTRTNMVEFS